MISKATNYIEVASWRAGEPYSVTIGVFMVRKALIQLI